MQRTISDERASEFSSNIVFSMRCCQGFKLKDRAGHGKLVRFQRAVQENGVQDGLQLWRARLVGSRNRRVSQADATVRAGRNTTTFGPSLSRFFPSVSGCDHPRLARFVGYWHADSSATHEVFRISAIRASSFTSLPAGMA